MSNFGIAQFYYTKRLPDRAAAIAKAQARPSTARDLVDLFSAPFNSGALTAKPYPIGDPIDAAVLGNTILITGSEKYLLENQFFEITNQVDDTGGALYYRHRLPNVNLQAVTITDLAGNVVKDGWVLRNGDILHSFKGEAYWVSYYENRMAQKRLLMYTPVIRRGAKVTPETYTVMAGGVIRVASASETYRLRFTQANGYRVMSRM
jgi:hypothetical protein